MVIAFQEIQSRGTGWGSYTIIAKVLKMGSSLSLWNCHCFQKDKEFPG